MTCPRNYANSTPFIDTSGFNLVIMHYRVNQNNVLCSWSVCVASAMALHLASSGSDNTQNLGKVGANQNPA